MVSIMEDQQMVGESLPIPQPMLGFEFFRADPQVMKEDNVVDHQRLQQIKEKVEKAAEAAEKASEGFEKLRNTLRDLSASTSATSATWDEAVQRYIGEGTSQITDGTLLEIKFEPVAEAFENSTPPVIKKNHIIEVAEVIEQKRKRRKRTKRVKDPNRPKKPPNAFMIFLVEQCEKMKLKEAPGALHAPQVGKIVGERWQSLPIEQKKIFEDRYEKSKKKYEDDLKVYYAGRDEKATSSQMPIKDASDTHDSLATTTNSLNRSPTPVIGSASHEAASPSTLKPVPSPIKMRKNGKKNKKVKDANRPKKPANPYAMYLADQCSLMKARSEPGAFNAPHIGKVVSEQWRALSDEDKLPYQVRYNTAKSRYDEELRLYNADKSKPTLKPREDISPDNVVSRIVDDNLLHDFGKPIPNGDHDDLEMHYIYTTKNKPTNPDKAQADDSSAESDAMEKDNGDNSTSFDITEKVASLAITVPTAKKGKRPSPLKRKASNGKGLSNEDEPAGSSDANSPDTPSSDSDETSPLRWSLKGFFSGFKRPKFF